MLSRESSLQVLRGLRRPRQGKVLLACALLGIAASAQAAELGRARMLSGVGQPLYVEIPINDVLQGRTPAHFVLDVTAGQASDGGLTDTVRFEVNTELRARADGSRDLIAVVKSNVPMRRPVVDLDVALRSPDGMQRRRVVLLLPPSLHPTVSPIALARGAQPARAAAVPSAGDSTITVRSGATAGRIAQRLLTRKGYDSATLYQALAALLQANPSAFVDGNLNRLRAGSTLRIPDAAAMQAIDAEEARRLYSQHMRDYAAYRGRVAQGAVAAKPAASGGESSGRISTASPPPAPPSGRDELRLSSAAVDAAGGQAAVDRLLDERAATQRALADAQARSGELERNIQSMQGLLDLQNATLARLQQQGQDPATQAGAAGASATQAEAGAAPTAGGNPAAGSGNQAASQAGAGPAIAAGVAAGATAGAAGQSQAMPANGAMAAAAGNATDSVQDKTGDSAAVQPGWTQTYFWPVVVLVLAFLAIVLALVFRKRSIPISEVQGVRKPMPADSNPAPAGTPPSGSAKKT